LSPEEEFIADAAGVWQTIPPHDALRKPETTMEDTFCLYDENLHDGETQEPDEETTEGSRTAQTFVLP